MQIEHIKQFFKEYQPVRGWPVGYLHNKVGNLNLGLYQELIQLVVE